MTLRLLILGAHPDDADYAAGGLAALYCAAGHDVLMVSLTNGDAGHHAMSGPALATRRAAEATAAAAVIGAKYLVLGNHDGELLPTLENRRQVIGLMRSYNPDLVLTHRPNDYHPDHRYTSQLVQDAAYMVTVPAVLPGTPHLSRNPVIMYLPDEFAKPNPFQPAVVLDVGSVVEKIADMLHCHTSQFYEWLPFNTGVLEQVPHSESLRAPGSAPRCMRCCAAGRTGFAVYLPAARRSNTPRGSSPASTARPSTMPHAAGCSHSPMRDAMRNTGKLRAWQYRLPRRFLVLVGVPFLLVLGGTLGYYWIENLYGETWSLLDAVYMTVITLSTIGFDEVHHLSDAGRVFTILLILVGVFTFFYTASEIIRSVVSGEVAEMLGQQQRERALTEISGHIIVCGYGRMGRLVCAEFSRDGVPFVLVDVSEEGMHDFNLPHGLTLVGDATSDAVLKQAGIDRARALVSVMASDADNLFATLSNLTSVAEAGDLYIVAAALRRCRPPRRSCCACGAKQVVSPYPEIGGTRVAQAVLRPTVVDFIELATRTEHIDLQAGRNANCREQFPGRHVA